MSQTFKLGAPLDSESVVNLFADISIEFERTDGKVELEILPIAVIGWLCRPNSRVGLEEVRNFALRHSPSGHGPVDLALACSESHLRTFRDMLHEVLRRAPNYGIEDVHQVGRIMVALSQSYGPVKETFRKHNASLVEKRRKALQKSFSPNSPRTIEAPVVGKDLVRPSLWPLSKPVGGRCEVPSIVAMYGTHIGPNSGRKNENQDAAYAIGPRSMVIFALADGVSSSFGSGFSASRAVQIFCSNLEHMVAAGRDIGPSELRTSLVGTRRWLVDALTYLSANPSSRDWLELQGSSKIPRDSASVLCRQTLTGGHPQRAVMASTFLGGVACSDGKGRLNVTILMIGDGSIEKISRDHDKSVVSSLIDATVKGQKLDHALSPYGGNTASQIAGVSVIETRINSNELLLLASDGLTTGHDSFASAQIERLLRKPLSNELYSNIMDGDHLLTEVCEAVDRQSEAILQDNLSLIVLGPQLNYGRSC